MDAQILWEEFDPTGAKLEFKPSNQIIRFTVLGGKIAFMKGILPLVILFVLLSCKDSEPAPLDPNLRFFRFSSCPMENHGNWQDTSFVAATSDPVVIQQCLDQLALPLEERFLFPLGSLAKGSGGYNINDTHHFSWHFVEDDWQLVEIGIEIYDGCAYSDAELANYRKSMGRYGGWGNRVVEELELN